MAGSMGVARDGFQPRSKTLDDNIEMLVLKGEAVFRIARELRTREKNVRDVINERGLVSPSGVKQKEDGLWKKPRNNDARKLPEIYVRKKLDELE